MIKIKTLFFFQGNPQNNDQIPDFEMVLHDRPNNLYAPVTPSLGDQRQSKEKTKT